MKIHETTHRTLKINIQPDSPTSLYLQLKEQVKEYIIANKLTRGTLLPSIKIIALEAGVTLQTAERGMTELVREGICFRRPKKGTFVGNVNQANRVTCVGIYHDQNLNNNNQLDFYSILNSQLCEHLTAKNIQVMVWMDSRNQEEKNQTPPQDLIEAINNRKIQFMFIPMGNNTIIKYLNEHRFPYSVNQGKNGNNVIIFDSDLMLKKTFEALKINQVKTVGMITNETNNSTPSGKSFKTGTLCHQFMKMAKEHGFTTDSNWIKTPEILNKALDQCGYDLFLEFWQEEERPEALFVFPDTVAKGVISAILELNLNIPADLRLVFHKNREIPLFHPFQATHITNYIEDVTKGHIQLLTDYINDRKPTAQTVSFDLDIPK